LIDVLCVAAEHGGLIKKKERERRWVKVKAFPTNVWRRFYIYGMAIDYRSKLTGLTIRRRKAVVYWRYVGHTN